MDVPLVQGPPFNKIMIVQLMLNKWVFNAVMVGTPVPLHDAAQRGVHIKVPPESTEFDFLDAFTILTYSLTFFSSFIFCRNAAISLINGTRR